MNPLSVVKEGGGGGRVEEREGQPTRDISRQYNLQQILIPRSHLQSGRAGRSVQDKPPLAKYADGVEHEEGVVAEPHQQQQHARLFSRRGTGAGGGGGGQGDGKVRVAYHLGDAPGEEHGSVGGVAAESGELVDYGPDDEVAAEYLDEGSREGGADDSFFFFFFF